MGSLLGEPNSSRVKLFFGDWQAYSTRDMLVKAWGEPRKVAGS